MGNSKSSEVAPPTQAPDADANHPDNVKAQHEGWTSLTQKPRGCTDCLCMLMLIACWVAMTAVGFIAIGLVENPNLPAGNPRRLINAVDYQGKVCGYGDLHSKPYGYYLLDKTAVCVSSCPAHTDFNAFVCHYDDQDSADASTTTAYQKLAENACFFKIETSAYLNRCIPKAAVDLASQVVVQAANNVSWAGKSTSYDVSTSKGWFSDFLGDVVELRAIIFGIGLGVSTVVAFLYLYILRIPGFLFLIIWSIIFSIQAILVVGAFLMWSLANAWADDNQHSDYEVKGAWILAYITMGIAFLYFCLMLVLRSRVQLAIGIVQQAGKALGNMQTLLLAPLFQVIALAMFMAPWIIYVIYLASSGELKISQGTYTYNGVEQQYTYRTFEYTVNTKYAFLYMLFSYYWTSEFIVACGQMIIALAFSNWYFTRDKSTTGNTSVSWALWATFRYHMGTSAFGSLLIAIVKTIRAIIAYLTKKAKQSGNMLAVYVLSAIQCCMWCVEKCMKFLNKNAYIQTAIYGYSFCKSARRAFFLLIRNILRVSAVNIVAEFVLLLGKLFIVGITVFLAYLAMAYGNGNASTSGIISPLIFVACLAYGVASIFSEIFGMGIETILCCYIADEEMFPPEQRFADGELKSSLQKAAERAAAVKAKVAPAPIQAVSDPAPSAVVL